MLQSNAQFSSYSVDNLEKAKEFYGKTLGLKVTDDPMGIINVELKDGKVMLYPKDDHVPATYTVLNFVVADIDQAVDQLTADEVTFERYDEGPGKTDEKGIVRGEQGPAIAWFKDPAGNILSVLTNE